MTTYNRGGEAINSSSLYEEMLEKRGVTQISQYKLKLLGNKIKDLDLSYSIHYWSHGDKYYKLANKYYNDFKLWWIIALYNEEPSEANLNYGDKIKIPSDPDAIIGAVGG